MCQILNLIAIDVWTVTAKGSAMLRQKWAIWKHLNKHALPVVHGARGLVTLPLAEDILRFSDGRARMDVRGMKWFVRKPLAEDILRFSDGRARMDARGTGGLAREPPPRGVWVFFNGPERTDAHGVS